MGRIWFRPKAGQPSVQLHNDHSQGEKSSERRLFRSGRKIFRHEVDGLDIGG